MDMEQRTSKTEQRLERLEYEVANQRIKAANTVLIAATAVFAFASIGALYQGWVGIKSLESLERNAKDQVDRIEQMGTDLDGKRSTLEETITDARTRADELKALADSAAQDRERWTRALSDLERQGRMTGSSIASLLPQVASLFEPKLSPEISPGLSLNDRIQAWSDYLVEYELIPGVAEYRGQLSDSEIHQVSMRLGAGEHRILALCDGCGDIDLSLRNADGVVLVNDTRLDIFPYVDYTPTSTEEDFTIDVNMYQCNEATCGWAVVAYRRQ